MPSGPWRRGFAPGGHVATVAETSRVEALPAGPIDDRDVVDGIDDRDVVDGLTHRLAEVIDQARDAMGEAAVRDSVTEDLLIEVVTILEKLHWMLRAQRSSTPS